MKNPFQLPWAYPRRETVRQVADFTAETIFLLAVAWLPVFIIGKLWGIF